MRTPRFLQMRLDRLLRPAAPPSPGAVTELAQRDIYILPTRHGLLFALLLLVMLLGAMNYNNSLGFLLTFLLASLAIVSILHAYRDLAGLRIEGVRAEPVFAGQDALFRVTLNNPTAAMRRALTFRTEHGPPISTDLAAAARSVVTLPVPAPRRGRQPFGRLTLETRFPLGLFRAWAYWRPESHVTVYPKPAPPLPLPAGAAPGGHYRDAPDAGVDDFRGFRAYRPGDSLRHVNWKALARDQGLQIKQFSTATSDTLWLTWNATTGGDIESRLSQLCRWVVEAQRLGLSFGLSLPDGDLPPALDDTHVQRALNRLALFTLP